MYIWLIFTRIIMIPVLFFIFYFIFEIYSTVPFDVRFVYVLFLPSFLIQIYFSLFFYFCTYLFWVNLCFHLFIPWLSSIRSLTTYFTHNLSKFFNLRYVHSLLGWENQRLSSFNNLSIFVSCEFYVSHTTKSFVLLISHIGILMFD